MNHNPGPIRRMSAPAAAKKFGLLLIVLAIQILPALGQSGAADPVPAPGEARLEPLVEANVIGVHAYELLLARKQGKGDPACWPKDSPTNTQLEALVAHQSSLLAAAPGTVKAWAAGERSEFEPAKDLQLLLAAALPMIRALPVDLFTAYLEKMAPTHPRSHIRGIANLYQTVPEIECDGDILQQLFAFYIDIGLPEYVGQLGLPGSDEDFLAVGRQLEGQSCPKPLDLTIAGWQIAGRKIWNWGEKNLHLREARILANQLLAESDVAPLIPKMKPLPVEKVAIISRSFTMDLRWSSPSAFVPIVTAMFARENSSVQFRQFQAGGLTSSRAFKNFYQDALAWKPSIVLLVVANRSDEDRDDLRKMGEGFRAAEARVVMFDNILDRDDSDRAKLQNNLAVARNAGIEVIQAESILNASPDRPRFSCLDHIHMTEPYHRLMAKHWLKVLVNSGVSQ